MPTRSYRQPLHIMVIVSERRTVRELDAQLTEVAPQQFVFDGAASVADAIVSMRKKPADVLILDVAIANGRAKEVMARIREEVGDIPIVVLTSVDDQQAAIGAVHDGAQDYIVREHVNNKHIAQSLFYAIERQRLRDKLVEQSLIDELTDLNNRRGFVSLSDQQARLANRTKRGLLLFYIDLDGMKKINDSFGHHAGDMALVDTAKILRQTFRQSDIIARIGGDEFAVLALETALKNKEIVMDRLEKNLKAAVARGDRPYQLALSVGVVTCDMEKPISIEAMLAEADTLMYAQKKSKRKAG